MSLRRYWKSRRYRNETKKAKIGYWVSTTLFDIGIILLAQNGWESRGYWLHPLLELGLVFLLPGIAIGFFTQRCPFCGKFLGVSFFAGKKEFCPYCGTEFDKSKGEKEK